jgi:drug/metabolite transporter (DMT)-like permease
MLHWVVDYDHFTFFNFHMLKPYLEVLLAAAIWGSSGVFVKSMACEPVVISFFRLAIPSVFMIFYSLIVGKKLFRNISKEMWAASFLNALALYLYVMAFSMTTIGNVVIILYTWPIFATILSSIFLKERVNGRTLILLVTAFVGILLVFLDKDFSLSDRDFVAMLAVLAAAFLWAVTMIMFKKGLDSYSSVQTIFYQNMIGGVACLPFLVLHTPITLRDSIIGISYGMTVGVAAFLLFFSALRKIAPSKAFILTYFEVISAIVFGSIFFHETLPLNVIVGGIVIISSIVLLKQN